MARTHVWKFLVNQAGEPIENAKVYVTLAGTDEAVWVYFDEFGSAGTRTDPQISTLENGFFECWIDELEDFDPEGTVDNANAISYGFSQKFKMRWEKVGIANGWVDYIDVFPPNRYFRKLDLTNCSSESLDKVISNSLGCKWDQHAEWDIRLPDNGLPVHGLEYVRVEDTDYIQNKIISNRDGWRWEEHHLSTVQSPLSAGYGLLHGTPHDLHPVDVLSQDETFNKVVNNKLMYDIVTELNLLAQIVMTIQPLSGSGADAYWGLTASGSYEATLTHDQSIPYPDVTCYMTNELAEEVLVKTAEVIYLDDDNIKVRIEEQQVANMTVRITS